MLKDFEAYSGKWNYTSSHLISGNCFHHCYTKCNKDWPLGFPRFRLLENGIARGKKRVIVFPWIDR